MESYWDSLRRRSLRRRTFVKGTALGAGGALSLALVGCGDDDDDDDATATETSTATEAAATSTATSAPSGSATAEASGTEAPSGTVAPGATEPAGLVRGGTATWASGGSITHVDPHRDAPVPGLAVATTVYSGLIRNEVSGGETLNQHPDVAESWEQPDSTTFTFSLRENATWWDRTPTDGRALTAEDVVLNFQRMVSPEPDFSTRELFTSMETVEAVDEHTVRFVMSEPDAYFLINVGSALPRLLAPEIHEGDLAKQNVAGAGPFQPPTDTIDLTQSMEFVKNENFYLEGAPYLDRIVMNIIVDAAARDAALRGRDIDWLEQFSFNPDVIEGFQGDLDDLQVFDYAYFPHKASMNTRKEPFGDKRVRQAVAHAMDQQGFLDLVNFGKGRQSWAMPPWLGDWAVSESEFPAFDPAESIALLEAAGYPDGIEITDSVFTGYDFYSVATQEQLAVANIRTNIELSEFGVWYGNVYSGGNYQFSTTGDFQFENPDRNLRTYYHSKGTLNNTFLQETDPDAVADFDKLVDDARRSLDIDEQKALLGDAQRWIWENCPAAYGGYIYTVILVQGRLQNYNIQPAYTTGGLQGMQFGYMWVTDGGEA